MIEIAFILAIGFQFLWLGIFVNPLYLIAGLLVLYYVITMD